MKPIEAREIVKQFVSAWPDEKVAAVFAFNEDGKMHCKDGCNCLVGVHSSATLHVFSKFGDCPDLLHYSRAKVEERVRNAEYAYVALVERWSDQPARNRIFGEILSEVMAEREASRSTEQLAEAMMRDMAVPA